MRTLFALRALVGIPWVLFWNAGLLCAWWLEGWRSSLESAPASWVAALTMLATAAMWTTIWFHPGARALAFAESRKDWIDERDIRLWAVIPLVMAVAILNQLYGWWN